MSNWDILKHAEEQRLQADKLHWEGTFTDYLDVLAKNPKIADLSHARLYDMVIAAGVDDPGEGQAKNYKFFEDELFGMEKTIQHLVEEYLAPAARRLDIRKRILMLVGPVGGGKSTLVTLIKRGLEKYSRTDEGAIYAIKGSPMHEEPLHLIPEELRPQFKAEFGVHIEGDLDPVTPIASSTSGAVRSMTFPSNASPCLNASGAVLERLSPPIRNPRTSPS